MSENKYIYPEGVRLFGPREGAPDFVVGAIIINPNELIAWLKNNPDILQDSQYGKQLKLDILKAKDGRGLNAPVNTYKPQSQPQGEAWTPKQVPPPRQEPPNDLPF